MDAELPTWEQLHAEHGRIRILCDPPKDRKTKQALKRERLRRELEAEYVRRWGFTYEEYKIRKEEWMLQQLRKHQANVAGRIAELERSAAVREMRASGYVHLLQAWRDIALGPGGIVCRRAHADFVHNASDRQRPR